MKMFRSDQRKDFRHDLTEEELEELRARRRTSPGKISGTMGLVYMSRHAAEQVEESWASEQPNDWRRWADEQYEDGLSGRTGPVDDVDGRVRGRESEAKHDVAWRPEAASVRRKLCGRAYTGKGPRCGARERARSRGHRQRGAVAG